FLVELVAKTFYFSGQLSLKELAERIKLNISVLEPVLYFMRGQKLCEVLSRGSTDTEVIFALTDLGRARGEEALRKSQYIGAAPVELEDYVAQVEKQSIRDMVITPDHMASAFSGVVIREHLLEQFGAAMNSGRAIFIYGPAGGGKTFIAEKLVGTLSGNVCIPYAISVDGEVIQVFDPLAHRPVYASGQTQPSLDRVYLEDERWIVCRRPVVVTGGELTLSVLDLEFDHTARYYNAPPQVKANNGLFIIDDLGRQLVQPRDLMNRWIVPLDRRVDYLALHTGKKFKLPFDVIVIFSTNLNPSELADEAFLRRLGYKIRVGAMPKHEYRDLFKQVCDAYEVPYSDDGFEYLVRDHHMAEGRLFLACIPRDLIGQLVDRSRYLGTSPEMSHELLDWAWQNYFVTE
ncbi:MAG: ATP-binding protein, partial [Burkholderiales bacterium]